MISKTDLARRTRQVVDRARRGDTIIVESYGEEQVVVMDAVDYRILRAVAARHALGFSPTPIAQPAPPRAAHTGVRMAAAGQADGESPQVCWNRVVTAYLDGQIDLGRAAALVGLSTYELDERFRRLELPRRVEPEPADGA
jgi:prevent-host-death family protein